MGGEKNVASSVGLREGLWDSRWLWLGVESEKTELRVEYEVCWVSSALAG